MVHVVLVFSEVEVVNEQILVFTGSSSRLKNLLKIIYTGEELAFFCGWCTLNGEQREMLKGMLNEQYGNSPFNEEKAKKDFEKNIRYEL